MLPVARPGRALRRSVVGLVLAATGLLAACSGGGGFTPLPSGAPLPTDCATVDADKIIHLSANDLDFSAPCIIAPAGTAFTIRFTNHDSLQHNVAIYADSSKDTELFRGEIITGPDRTVDYVVDPISAGDHFFDCVVHPAMRGTIYVR